MSTSDDGDRPGDGSTALTATIYDCPRDQVAAVVAAIGEHISDGEVPGTWAPSADRLGTLFLGISYGNTDAPDGSGYPLVCALLDSAPKATFTVAEHANRNGTGAVWQYTPSLGLPEAEADFLGDSRFRTDQVLSWMQEWRHTAPRSGLAPSEAELRAIIAQRTGQAHRNRMQVPPRRVAEQALRVVAGATVGMTPDQARRARAAVRVDPWPRCATYRTDRRVRPRGPDEWVHVDDGRPECDLTVRVHLPGHVFHTMPATLVCPPSWPAEPGWLLELPNRCLLRVPRWNFTFARIASPAAQAPRPDQGGTTPGTRKESA